MEQAIIKKNNVSAENQMKNSSAFFGYGQGGKKILILGNSITRHAPNESLGWFGDWGMAASAREKDYVHLLKDKLDRTGKPYELFVRQMADWEQSLNDGKTDLFRYRDCRDVRADIVVYRLTENIKSEFVSPERYCAAVEEMLRYVCPENATVIFTSSFWKYDAFDGVTEQLAKNRNMPFVYLGDLGERDDMRATGLFSHVGVACHPGDAGMVAIADRIWQTLFPLL